MLRKNREKTEWLEFRLLQGVNLRHGVLLRQEGSEILGINDVVSLKQVHGKEIAIAERAGEEFVADGVITKVPGLGLAIEHADCQAAIFYDPVQKVIGAVHAGWRGMVQNIYREMIVKMEAEFGVCRENLLVCIGPSLEPEHSEFIHYKQEFPEPFWRFQVKPNYFNLWNIARYQLRELGILPHQIEVAEMGTYSHPLEFYSYRRNKTAVMRHTTLCALA